MKRLLRWFGIGLGGLASLALLAFALVYVLSELKLRHRYDVPAAVFSAPDDPVSIGDGRRLATIYGCYTGCHGLEASGAMMFDQPIVARVVAPSLTVAVHTYSDTELALIIRHGIKPDGHSLFIMPSEAFVMLSDADLGRIIAFLKSLPEVPGPGPSVSIGPVGRLGLATGQLPLVAQLIADTVPPPAAPDDAGKHGRYLAQTACAGCHGADLRGTSNPDFTSPDLRITAAYDRGQFKHLIREGMALGERELGTMSPWARKHLSHFTDQEIADLYSYLHALGAG